MTVTLAQMRTYLGSASTSYTDDQINDAIAVETAAQATDCTIPSPVPPVLDMALKRRVQALLLAIPIGLGYQVSMSDVTSSTNYVGGRDVMVRRLESPFRKWVVG